MDVERHGGRSVAEHPLNGLRGRAGRDREARGRVAEVVHGDVREVDVGGVCCLQSPGVPAAVRLRLRQVGDTGAEHELVASLAFARSSERLGKELRERHRAALVSLRCAEVDAVLGSRYGTAAILGENFQPESVVNRGKMNDMLVNQSALMSQALRRLAGAPGQGATFNVYEAVSPDATAKAVMRRMNRKTA